MWSHLSSSSFSNPKFFASRTGEQAQWWESLVSGNIYLKYFKISCRVKAKKFLLNSTQWSLSWTLFRFTREACFVLHYFSLLFVRKIQLVTTWILNTFCKLKRKPPQAILKYSLLETWWYCKSLKSLGSVPLPSMIKQRGHCFEVNKDPWDYTNAFCLQLLKFITLLMFEPLYSVGCFNHLEAQ